MKNWKRLIVLTLVICCTIICASCNSCSEDPVNKEVPAISNKDNAFLQIGNYKVSNNKAYYQLLNSYGVETVIDMISDDLLPAITDENDFKDYLNSVIYGEEEQTAEALEEFLEKLPLSGLSAKSSDANYYENYYRLTYRRIQYAKSVLKAEIAEYDAALEEGEDPYYTEEVKEAYFESLYRKETKAIIIRFDSQNEANYYLENVANIDLDNVNGGWSANGVKLTSDQVVAAFEAIYKAVNNTTDSGVINYTYDDLLKVSSALSSAVYNWDAGRYTLLPTSYNNQVYLAYKVSETGNLEDGNVVTFEQKENEIVDTLMEAELTNAYVSKAILELAQENELKIYDRGLEVFYGLTYDSVYAELGNSEYDEFATTDEESSSIVFSYKVNGTVKNVSADDLFARLSVWYGEYLASTYIKQYLVLKDNKVYDITSGTILDRKSYDEYYELDVQEYKDAFEDGEYESVGFPSTYGWDNFVRDYLGILNEAEIILNVDSTLYEECLADYKESLYLVEEQKDEDGKVTVTVDQKVQDKMTEIYNKYFNLTAVGITAYYDKNLDGTADEIENDNPLYELRDNLVKTVYNKVAEMLEADDTETVSTALAKILLEYKLANGKVASDWQSYKDAGLILSVLDSTSYTHNSAKDEAILTQLRTQYNRFIAYKNKVKDGEAVVIGTDLSGVSLVSTYRYTSNDTRYTLRATDSDFMFKDGANDIVVVDNTSYCYFVTKITKPTTISSSTYKPTRAQYLSYLEDSSSVISSIKNCITNYYIPAIDEIASDDIVNNSLVTASISLLDVITYADKEGLTAYINACYITEEE